MRIRVYCFYIVRISYLSPFCSSLECSLSRFSSLFNTVCAIGTNGLAFLLPVELTPLQTRGKSVAISTGFFWLCNFFVVMISPVLISRIKYGTYILWAGTNLCFIPMIYFLRTSFLEIIRRKFFRTWNIMLICYNIQFRKPARLLLRTLTSCLKPTRRGSLVPNPR